MSMFGFYFVQALLEQAGWPKKKGLFGGPAYDTFIVDEVIDQMLGWGASLAAGRPKLSLKMTAEMFRDKDWDGDNPPDVKMVVDGSREGWDKVPEGGPSEVIKLLMINVHPEYIVDENLNRKSVVLPYSEWENIVEEMEELDDIRAYDQAKNETEEGVVPFEQAVKEIEDGIVK